jgi:hypothetical protein
MIDWCWHHWFLEDMVSPRRQIDVLPVSRLFLIQRLLNKELKRLMEVFVQVAILHNQHWQCCIDRLWKVLVKQLFPGRSVVALEHILELHKGV